ncbi:uncharacterized protein LACBIDRAFT_388237 [Laccaria bicolor S238N-H82]|uniref:Predicted protein n=1 Tax=Laccaria bicolor (strain S238N-H82 / ATCC MYA-4686) TaxID=486041 RepID=B0DDE2_LACBS|nr:uncharacterized protein LACBIDRAFT_388237 [Laccaria bicolor S238N-H82]EDR07594.1 predicted protein [Laccaria bicolor S238N-H82]|eukprot:XP_001881986.1 predicted protein [Laccaria bicolor S238N-H82]
MIRKRRMRLSEKMSNISLLFQYLSVLTSTYTISNQENFGQGGAGNNYEHARLLYLSKVRPRLKASCVMSLNFGLCWALMTAQEGPALGWLALAGLRLWAGPGTSLYKKVVYHNIDLAIAWDFERTILGAYRWLSDNYEEGDCIFLFGFSRGAFQVRVLSAMIDKVGLIYKGNNMQIPFAYQLYADSESGARPVSDVGANPEEKTTMADRFKKAFSHENLTVHFIGAWDTVSSIGITRGKSLPETVTGMAHVCYFRHALALDERRVKFLPEYAYGGSATPVKPTDKTREPKGSFPHIKEVWFAGSHSDIGGGGAKNTNMDRARPPLRWMVFEAGEAGLRTALFKRELKEDEHVNVTESMKWPWHFLEIFPFKRLTYTHARNGSPETTRMPHRWKGRKIHPGQKIHISLVWAAAELAQNYIPKARPPPLDDGISFWEKLRIEKEQIPNNSEWLELDRSYHIKLAVQKLVTQSDDALLKSLHDTSMSADTRQGVYDSVIDALEKKQPTLTLDNKNRLLHTTMQLLKKSPRNKPDFKLRTSHDIRPLLSDLLADTNYQQTACEFVTVFTDFAFKVTHLQDVKGFAGCAISPDGRRIAAGFADGSVRIWDTETDRPVGEPLQGHRRPVLSVAFSPSGTRMVSGSKDGTIRIWDAENGSPLGEPLQGHNDPVLSVAFSPEDTRIASGSEDGTIRIWDAETGAPLGEPLEGHDRLVLSIAFSPDSKRIVSGSDDKTIRIWNAETGSPVGGPLRGHNDWIRSVAFSP